VAINYRPTAPRSMTPSAIRPAQVTARQCVRICEADIAVTGWLTSFPFIGGGNNYWSVYLTGTQVSVESVDAPSSSSASPSGSKSAGPSVVTVGG
jgi:hypothetical protein